jgi:hypothetical protein
MGVIVPPSAVIVAGQAVAWDVPMPLSVVASISGIAGALAHLPNPRVGTREPLPRVNPDAVLLDLESAALLAGMTVHALRHLRQRGQLPPDVFIVHGSRVRVHRERFERAILKTLDGRSEPKRR